MMAFTNTVTLSLVNIWNGLELYYFSVKSKQNLLRGNIISRSSHVYFLEDIQTGDDEEDPRPPGSSPHQATQPEDDGSLVLLAGF